MEILIAIILAMALWIGSLYGQRRKLTYLLADQTMIYTVLYKAAIMSGDCEKLIDYMTYYNDQMPYNSNNTIIKSLYNRYGLEADEYDSIDLRLRNVLKAQSKQDYLTLRDDTPRYDRLVQKINS